MAEYLPLFLGLTFLGFAWAFPVLIPPLRRWLRGRYVRRLMAIVLFSGSVLYLIFLVFSFFSAKLSSALICNPSMFTVFEPNGDTSGEEMANLRADMKVCNDEKAVQLGFTNGAEMETAVNQEIFRQYRTFSPFRQDCYADDPAFCEFIVSSPPEEMGSFSSIIFVIVYVWPAFVTGLLVWFWTRPRTLQST